MTTHTLLAISSRCYYVVVRSYPNVPALERLCWIASFSLKEISVHWWKENAGLMLRLPAEEGEGSVSAEEHLVLLMEVLFLDTCPFYLGFGWYGMTCGHATKLCLATCPTVWCLIWACRWKETLITWYSTRQHFEVATDHTHQRAIMLLNGHTSMCPSLRTIMNIEMTCLISWYLGALYGPVLERKQLRVNILIVPTHYTINISKDMTCVHVYAPVWSNNHCTINSGHQHPRLKY